MTTDTKRRQSLAILKALREAGFESYWAGGCVRDLLLGRTPKDFDIATSATPEDVRPLFARTLDVGAQFGVLLVVMDGEAHEVATFRRDLEYKDGRRPEGVEFSAPEEDALRRDFTVNGLFYDPDTEEIIDFVEGRVDVERRVIRAIGDPQVRFGEDYLRMLRAVRLASTLDFQLDPDTAAAIRELAMNIRDVSSERVRDELTRLLTESPRAGQGLLLLHEVGLLAEILPEITAMEGQEQPPAFHPEGDVLTHTVMMLDAMEAPSPVLAYAVLLHDVGKPPTAALTREPDGSDRIRFNGHAKVGADMAEQILRRLRLPNRTIEAVVHCVANHMRFMDVPNMRRATLRKMVGAETFPVELELHRLDCLSSHGDLSNWTLLEGVRKEFEAEVPLPEPWVSGHDIMRLGIPEGPDIGAWRQRAYDRQLEGQAKSREDLLQWLCDQLAEIKPES